MSIAHAQPGQPASVTPYGDALLEQRSTALFKSDDLEVIRLVLRAGKSMPEHSYPREITIQGLEGHIDVRTEEGGQVVRPGELMYLRANVPHRITALQDASALITMVLNRH